MNPAVQGRGRWNWLLLWAATQGALACSSGEAPASMDAPHGEGPNVLVFCMDTVRADRMGLYGAERSTTPVLDRLALEGALFEDAQAPSPWTLPSVGSIFTGRFPAEHGAQISGELHDLRNMTPADLRAGVPTLAERFAEAGYRCEAYVTNAVLAGGMRRGFHEFTYASAEGAEVARFGLQALERLQHAPFFLWLHFMDAHDPLLVSSSHVLAVTAGETGAARGQDWARTMLANKLPGFVEERRVLYDASIHYIDFQIGRVLEGLGELGLDDSTLVVVLADHGEEHHDHLEAARSAGYVDPRGVEGVGHGHTLFQEQLHVPLLIVGPGVKPGRQGALVSLADVAPTLCELAGLPGFPIAGAGRSLVPLWSAGRWEERWLGAGSLAYGPDRRALINEDWKFIRGGAGEASMLFERASDPGEARNLALEKPGQLRRMQARLQLLQDQESQEPGAELEYSDEDLEALRALGYLGADGLPGD